MKRVSTIMLISELAKFGQLTIETRREDLSDYKPRYYCRYEVENKYSSGVFSVTQENVWQEPKRVLKFLKLATSCIEPGLSEIVDHIQDQLI